MVSEGSVVGGLAIPLFSFSLSRRGGGEELWMIYNIIIREFFTMRGNKYVCDLTDIVCT